MMNQYLFRTFHNTSIASHIKSADHCILFECRSLITSPLAHRITFLLEIFAFELLEGSSLENPDEDKL